LLLLKTNYDFIQYASLEFEIEKQKKQYYKALMAGQKNRYSKKEKIDKWMLFFLNAIKKTILKLESNYEKIKDKKSYLNLRQSDALDYIRNNEPIKISDLTNALKEYTPYILKKDVKYMVDEGLIKKIGKGKATIYIANK
jgi:Fic family protein